MSEIPKEDGFYFAMWLVSDKDTEKMYDCTPSRIWDAVELYTNDEGARRVYIPGVPDSQAADGFHWHPERLRPPPLKWPKYNSGASEEARRRYRAMTPEQRIEDWETRKRVRQ